MDQDLKKAIDAIENAEAALYNLNQHMGDYDEVADERVHIWRGQLRRWKEDLENMAENGSMEVKL